MTTPKRKPERLANIVSGVIDDAGLRKRIEQAAVIPEWQRFVGRQIAEVTRPQSITANGTLFVVVKTNAWMNELSLLEPELLRSLNERPNQAPIRRIRWQLGSL